MINALIKCILLLYGKHFVTINKIFKYSLYLNTYLHTFQIQYSPSLPVTQSDGPLIIYIYSHSNLCSLGRSRRLGGHRDETGAPGNGGPQGQAGDIYG